ncbi:NADH-quinone oxidoreductase subunit NuoI [Rhodosalinus sediminis]|jgi:NADH-quinone oxidoreductase subunit I|uniref:NADH-quinone oxidoreductase subunit I n=1 Tax=Rhodosalinus sediminis TaxID=1940533 RepID=A0A3D9BXC9_9RHOB|nr:NADH-quinone oxidoreductase subunit NuoI [Rhodosalinus sediminis]REC58177.1 NADH-quinone oxidoreductase subunit NuoI [Rhodosalinus sediminis]
MKGILESLGRIGAKLATRKYTAGYPEVKPELPARYRARIVLTRDPDGQERCVACNLCAAACPVDCIDVVKGETDDGRWYPETFRINFARCIFCGFCEEACPTQAIQLTPDFETADYARESLVHDKADLLIAGQGKQKGYRYWSVAGKAIGGKDKGAAEDEAAPVDLKDLTP